MNNSAASLKPFSLLVKPTSADCNLRCTYCFYLEKCRLYPDTAKHRMPETVLEEMIRGFFFVREDLKIGNIRDMSWKNAQQEKGNEQ